MKFGQRKLEVSYVLWTDGWIMIFYYKYALSFLIVSKKFILY